MEVHFKTKNLQERIGFDKRSSVNLSVKRLMKGSLEAVTSKPYIRDLWICQSRSDLGKNEKMG